MIVEKKNRDNVKGKKLLYKKYVKIINHKDDVKSRYVFSLLKITVSKPLNTSSGVKKMESKKNKREKMKAKTREWEKRERKKK